MNRLSNYFAAAKLCKTYTLCAEEELRKNKTAENRVLLNLLRAQRELIVAMNNVAAIAFNHKPK